MDLGKGSVATLLAGVACALLLASCGGSEPAPGDEGGDGGGDGGGEEGGGGGDGGGGDGVIRPLEKASFKAFTSNASNEELWEAIAGRFSVGVYLAAEASERGPAQIRFGYENGEVSVRVESDGGGVLAALSTPLDGDCKRGKCLQFSDHLTTPLGGRRFQIYDYYAEAGPTSVVVSVFPDGYIVGSAGGIAFRNNLLAYGEDVPEVFKTLAGEYEGDAEAMTCAPNPVEVEVRAEGSVRVKGKASLSCDERDLLVAWDGNDDLIVPHEEGGVVLLLDAGKIGGSVAGGGIVVRLPDATAASAFTSLHVNFEGANGHIGLPNPQKK